MLDEMLDEIIKWNEENVTLSVVRGWTILFKKLLRTTVRCEGFYF